MVEYDAVIVGAGIIGLSTAYHIKNKNPNAEILVWMTSVCVERILNMK